MSKSRFTTAARLGALGAMLLGGALGACPAADLRGHGGPVRAILVEGGEAVTASFDSTVIRWTLATGAARQVLRFHQGAVNALARLGDGRFASAGEDGRVALWGRAGEAPERTLEGHQGPVAALAGSPDGRQIASASWDGTTRLWMVETGQAKVIDGHRGPVNAVVFVDNGTVATAGYDGTLRIVPADGTATILEFGLPQHAMLVVGGELVLAGADGALRFVDPKTGASDTLAVSEVPIVALGASPDGVLLAAAGFRGALALVDRGKRTVIRKLAGPAFPLWSLAFSPDGQDILTGGADRLVRRWRVATGEPVNPILQEMAEPELEALRQHPGAEVFKACSACHALGADDGNRAGPTLHGIMGRKIGAAAGYAYSQGFDAHPIVWSRASIARLFEVGPNAMTPGTKMPEQTLSNAGDREALVDFLEKATR